MCPQIRDLFIVILMFCQPSNPRQLYDDYWQTWCDDIEWKALQKGTILTEEQKQTLVLLDLETKLQSHEMTLEIPISQRGKFENCSYPVLQYPKDVKIWKKITNP